MPRIDGQGGFIGSQASGAELVTDPVAQHFEPFPGAAADPDEIRALIVSGMGGEIGFVPDPERLVGWSGGEEIGVGGIGGGGEIEEAEDEIGAEGSLVTASDALGLDEIGGVAESGGVDEDDGQAADVGGFLDGIAGGAGDGRDDGAIESEQLVEQAGFAGIGTAEEDSAGAFAEESAFGGGPGQELGEVAGGIEASEQGDTGFRIDVFVGKIDVGFDMGEDEEEIVAEGMDALGEMTGELGMGGVQGELGAGVDEVDHGFGLGEVESAVEEGAPGEFAGFGEGCTGAEEGVEDLTGDEGTAVATDLDGILAGVGTRGAEDGEEDFIDATVIGVDVAVMDGVGGGGGGKRGRGATGLEAAVGDGEGLGA